MNRLRTTRYRYSGSGTSAVRDLISNGRLAAALTYTRVQATGVQATAFIVHLPTLVASNTVNATFARVQSVGVQSTGNGL